MTVTSSYSPDTYAGNGSTDTFAITFPFLSVSTNVKVSIKNDTTEVITVKTASTHYNVSGSNVVFTGGNIPASGETVILELNPDFQQNTDYIENSSIPASTLETDLDERVLETLANKDAADRSIKFDPAVDLSSFTNTIGATTASQYLQINSSGDGWTLSSGTSSGLDDVVDDTTPQLGGNLDVNGNSIVSTANADINIAANGTGTVDVTGAALEIDNGATGPGEVRLLEDSDNGTNYMGFKAPSAVTASVTFELPDGDGSNTQVLQTNGSGVLSWVNNAGGGGGISNVVEDTTPQLGGQLDVNGNAIGDGTRELITFTEDASAVNQVNIENQATGSGPIISAAGDDTNIDLVLTGKGTGEISITGASIKLDTTEGIKDAGGDEYLVFTESTTPVNHLNLTSADTGSGPSLVSAGDDTNVDFTIDTKGTGTLTLGSADATVAVASTMTVIDEIQHAGDTNNKIGFTTDTQTFTTGGSTRMDITDSGVQLGGANARVTTVLDEDTMSSDSATSLATQQSIKAYVDTEVTAKTESFVIAVSDETTAITTGTAKVTFRMPYAFTVTAVRASLTTASSSGTPTIDINETGTTILSTKLTIDANEKTSTTAATAAVISDSSLADDAEITIDIDTAGTGAAGLKVYIIGNQ